MATFIKAITRKSFTLSANILPHTITPYNTSLDHEVLLKFYPEIAKYIQVLGDDYVYTMDVSYTDRQKQISSFTVGINVYESPNKTSAVQTLFKDVKSGDIFRTPDGEVKVKMGDTTSNADVNTNVLCLNGIVLPNLIPLADGYPYLLKHGKRIDYSEEDILNLSVDVLGNVGDFIK